MRWMKCWRNSERLDSVPLAKISLALLFLFLAGSATAQEATIRSQSNVVLIPVLVKDARGHAVYGLKAQDFVVADDGVAQTMHLDEEAEAEPISLVIAVQVGGSAPREFSRIKGLSAMIQPILDQE